MKNARISEEQAANIISLYKELKSVWKVAKEINRCGQSVHEFLERRGEIIPANRFTKEDDDYLIKNYNKFVEKGKLVDLANKMGRTKQFLCRQAKRLGLTDLKRKASDKAKSKMSIAVKKWQKEKGHPRGMLGKKHSEKVVSDMKVRFKSAWADPNNKLNSEEHKIKMSDAMSLRQANNKDKSNQYTRTKKGWFNKDGVLIPMRSSWELNYAHYLNNLILLGEIVKWEYEVDTFKFEKFVKGIRSYTPDFKIYTSEAEFVYHEVKGWMDEKSILKLSMMKEFYPLVPIVIIDKKEYKKIEKQKDTIPKWGTWVTSKT